MFSFKQARDLFKAQREAKRAQKELKMIHVEAEAQGVKVTVAGTFEIVDIVIGEQVPRDRIPVLLLDALNRALKKAQVVSAERMQGVMGAMGLPTGGK